LPVEVRVNESTIAREFINVNNDYHCVTKDNKSLCAGENAVIQLKI